MVAVSRSASKPNSPPPTAPLGASKSLPLLDAHKGGGLSFEAPQHEVPAHVKNKDILQGLNVDLDESDEGDRAFAAMHPRGLLRCTALGHHQLLISPCDSSRPAEPTEATARPPRCCGDARHRLLPPVRRAGRWYKLLRVNAQPSPPSLQMLCNSCATAALGIRMLRRPHKPQGVLARAHRARAAGHAAGASEGRRAQSAKRSLADGVV